MSFLDPGAVSSTSRDYLHTENMAQRDRIRALIRSSDAQNLEVRYIMTIIIPTEWVINTGLFGQN